LQSGAGFSLADWPQTSAPTAKCELATSVSEAALVPHLPWHGLTRSSSLKKKKNL
jgi:hypothetical protein